MDVNSLDTAPTETTEVTTTAPVTETAPPVQTIEQKVESALSGAPEAATGTPATAAIPEYQPDFKYKVFREEKELDPRVRAIIKSKEDEEWVKKVFSAADGVEVFKNQAQEAKSLNQKYVTTVNQVLRDADLGDYGSVLKHAGVDMKDPEKVVLGLGFTPEQIIQVAYKLATLTPEAQAAYNKEITLERQNKETSMQAQTYQARMQELESQIRSQELHSLIAQPSVQPIVHAYDQTHGQGAFWEEVRSYGELVHYRTGKDIPLEEAVQATAKRFGVYAAPAPQAQVATPTQAQRSMAQPTELPVIPTVGNAGAQSPAKKRISSVADIERELQSL